MYRGTPAKLLVKLTAKQLHDWLSKLRSHDKHDVIEERMTKLIDTYERFYLSSRLQHPAGAKG